jgi:hypothetical protein
MRTTLATVVLIASVGAAAASVPVSGKLVLRREGGPDPDIVSFISRDPRLPLPDPTDVDAPNNAGVRIEVLSAQQGSLLVSVPPGDGWRVTDYARLPYYRFKIPYFARVKWRKGYLAVKTAPNGISLKHRQGAAGIRLTMGSHVMCAWFDGDAVRDDRPGLFFAKLSTPGSHCGPLDSTTTTSLPPGSTTTSVPGASTTSTTFPPGECGDEGTLHVIQDRIFNRRGCATSTCHGAFNTSGLDLRPGSAYWNLIDVAATNPAAAAAGKKRVVPGDPQASFLSQKLHGLLTASEGVRMPSVGRVLTPVELALVDEWIAAGAPAEEVVPTAPCLPREAYEPAPALPVPAGGYQIVLTGPTLQPGQEQEGCLWVPTPNGADFASGKWEFSLNPGTHHFAIFEWNKTWAPVTGVWTANDFGCFSGAEFGNNISGSPQAPYYVDAYPEGVARVLGAGKYLGLNAHYYNEFDVPIQVKVWINIYPYVGPTPKIARTIVDIDDTFNINLPPYTASVYPPLGAPRARWTNTSSKTWSVINLGGHMHSRGVRFTAWNSGGTKLYESFDWAHPNARYFTPSLDLPPGGYIDYECFYDNGIERPVRTNLYGQPVALTFGTSAEDAMCILTGQYFPR